jgi:hypothetical protein
LRTIFFKKRVFWYSCDNVLKKKLSLLLSKFSFNSDHFVKLLY